LGNDQVIILLDQKDQGGSGAWRQADAIALVFQDPTDGPKEMPAIAKNQNFLTFHGRPLEVSKLNEVSDFLQAE
jgi:ABC-type uncharacterized transport system ATPase component